MTPDVQRQLLLSSEAKVFSQFREDGILQMIFDRIGVTDRRFVEFGIGNGRECCTANLSIHHGWSGLLMDGNPTDAAKAEAFYASRPEIKPGQVLVRQAFITAENINDLLVAGGVTGTIDLLSLDIDGNDLWVWQAIGAIDPRVVVIEYNAAFGTDKSVSVVYDPAFERFAKHPSGLYHGAALDALAAAGRKLGYVLIGCESAGVNAFFVKAAEAERAGFVAISPQEAYYEHAWRKAKYPSTAAQWEIIKDLPYAVIGNSESNVKT
jgi:hypothetical protein